MNSRLIVGIRVWERHHAGITDMLFRFNDGTSSPRAFADSDQHCVTGANGGWREWEHRVPLHRWVSGIDARVQDHFGIVDLLPRVSPVTQALALPPYHQAFAVEDKAATAWELVQSETPGAPAASDLPALSRGGH